MSILDQVRKNNLQRSIDRFNPVETLNVLFSRLSEKEKDIIKRRFGLEIHQKQTLEEIGQHYGITRERVRQIENLSIKKLKELQELRDEIKEAEGVVVKLLDQYGGAMEERFFLENLLSYLETHPGSESSLLFLAEHIFSDNVNRVKQDKEWHHLWRSGSAEVDFLKSVVEELIKLIEKHNEPINLQELFVEFKNSEFYQANKDKFVSLTNLLDVTTEDVDKILESYLRTSRKVKKDLFERWGLVSWGTVQPKKINDKIYLVLKKAGQPLHFKEIARLINETKFDEKVAYPATVHNELILDDKYVLVGRGIYALREWGYKPGTVAEVIETLLKEKGRMSKEEIISQVLSQRQVKKSTIYLSLMNSKKFLKGKDGKYELVKEAVLQT